MRRRYIPHHVHISTQPYVPLNPLSSSSAAGPKGCALASPSSTPSSILAAISQLLQDLYDPYYTTLPMDLSLSSSVKGSFSACLHVPILNSTSRSADIFTALQLPSAWQGLATYLRSQMDLVRARGLVQSEQQVLFKVREARRTLKLERRELRDFWDHEF
jgi:hypothetical protein